MIKINKDHTLYIASVPLSWGRMQYTIPKIMSNKFQVLSKKKARIQFLKLLVINFGFENKIKSKNNTPTYIVVKDKLCKSIQSTKYLNNTTKIKHTRNIKI